MKKILGLLAAVVLIFASCEDPSNTAGGDDKLVDANLIGSWYKAINCELFILTIYGDGTAECGIYEDSDRDWVNYESDGSEITIWEDGDVEADYGSYEYALSNGDLAFTLSSDSDAERTAVVAGTWVSVMPAIYEVSGTITLPSDATGKKYYIGIDSNDDGGDGMNYIHGEADGSSIDYTVGGIPAGTYFMHLVVDMDGSWGDDDAGPVADGDYWAFYDMANGNPPDSASLAIAGDKTVNLTALEYVDNSASGSLVVSGTISFPASVTSKPLAIILDTDTDGSNGVAGAVQLTVSGSSYDFEITGVSAGSYCLYAILYNGDTTSSGPQSGDYLGAYGMTSLAQWSSLSASAEVTEEGANTFDFALLSL